MQRSGARKTTSPEMQSPGTLNLNFWSPEPWKIINFCCLGDLVCSILLWHPELGQYHINTSLDQVTMLMLVLFLGQYMRVLRVIGQKPHESATPYGPPDP